MVELLVFLATAVGVSLSGVMAPGPLTAATIGAGSTQRHAGLWVAVGHGVIELPLMLAIIAGADVLFEREPVRIGIGLVGGAVLLMMGAAMLNTLRRPAAGEPSAPPQAQPLLLSSPADDRRVARRRGPWAAGVVLTAANPYFLLWWATIGLALAIKAAALGAAAFVLFAIAHWLCDLVWLEALSIASFGGSKLMGRRAQRIIHGICAAALVVFGVQFIWHAGGRLF